MVSMQKHIVNRLKMGEKDENMQSLRGFHE